MLNLIENILIVLSMILVLCVVFVGNPIQALLSLILLFALSSMLFMIIGVEFISLLIFMVYVGAIAVLFLFIIMMLNLKIVELRNYYLRYLPIGSFIIIFFFFELCLFIYLEFRFVYVGYDFLDWFQAWLLDDNILMLVDVIYVYHVICFLCLAVILLVSMMGSIILVLNWGNARTLDMYNDIYFYKKSNKLIFIN